MNRIPVCLIVFVVGIWSGPAGAVDFTFAIWSDTHFGVNDGGYRDDSAQDILTLPGTPYPAEIGGTVGEIQFILTPGDITNNSYYHQYEDDDGVSDDDFITCINRWFVPLGIPIYEITGNHDSWNPPGCDQIRAAIAARHGATSYSFDYEGVHFVGLDGGPDGTNPFDPSALDYLEAHMPTLTTDQAVLIFNHYEGQEPQEPPHEQWERFYNAINGYNVIVHCVGHKHYPDVTQCRGIDIFITSDCSQIHPNPGFSVMRITGTHLTGIAYDWLANEWYQRNDPPHEYVIIDKAITGVGHPEIAVRPETLSPETTYQIDPPEDILFVSNSGQATLHYTITIIDDPDWLSVSPDSGSCSDEVDYIWVTYDTVGLDLGTYDATISVSDPEASNSPQTVSVLLEVKPIPGDFDADFDVDQEDFGHFQACLSGSGVNPTDPGCWDADLDGQEDVDQEDFGIFQKCLSGANVPADPQCAEG